jgi:hypothetical protein
MASESRRPSGQQSLGKNKITEPDTPAGIPVRVVFTDQRLTMAGFSELMENLEAFLTIGMAQPYELTLPQARARLADCMVITSISKSSPLVMGFDIQAGIQAVTQMITLAGGIIALRPVLATQLEKATRADLERQKLKLQRRIVDALIVQFDELPKKKRKKLISDKKFMANVEQAAKGLLNIDSITNESFSTTSPTSPGTGDSSMEP